MKKFVTLDSSVTLSWCFADEANSFSDEVLDYVKREGAIVPFLWSLEITNALLNSAKRNRITEKGVVDFLALFSKLPIRIAAFSAECFVDILGLAGKHGLSTYDASYLYLALREKAPLVTLDKALQSAAKKCKIAFSGIGVS